MRKSQTQKISEVLKEYLESNVGIQTGLKERQIINSWEEMIGKSVARATKDIYIKNKVMYIKLTSAVVRNELLMIRNALIEAINKKSGEEIVTKIVLK